MDIAVQSTQVKDVAGRRNRNTTVNLAGQRTFRSKGEQIYDEEDPTILVYFVVTGMVRVYKLFNDGRRQITGFYVPGEMFGLDGASEHSFSASAVIKSEIVEVRRDEVMSRAAASAEIAVQLWTVTNRELDSAQKHILFLAKSAPDRVMSFLLGMAGRLNSDNEVHLPMTRQDIADHLGLTTETVCRTLAHLQKQSAIALPSAHHVILKVRDRARASEMLTLM